MKNLVGIRHEESIIVDDSTAISFLGHPDARVLGTPWMILWMERTSREAVKPSLPPGWDTVGTAVNIRHLSAAGMGARVLFRAEVLEQEELRILFRISAETDHGLVGEGTHERTMVHIERFAAGVARRKKPNPPAM